MADETTVPVEALIKDLLDTGTMNEDSVADLERIRTDFQAGALHPDDASYLVAFHHRIMGSDNTEVSPVVSEAPVRDAGAADLTTDLAAALARAERAEAEVARLSALLAARDDGESLPTAP